MRVVDLRPLANCRDLRSRLKEAERILERYETNIATVLLWTSPDIGLKY